MAMHDYCPCCGLRYMREPGFFYGAMYIAYGFSVAVVLTAGLATNILGNDPDLWVYLTVVTIGLLIASPVSFRYARVLMLHIFSGVTYEADAISKFKVSNKNNLTNTSEYSQPDG